MLCRLRPAPAGSLRCFAAAPTALPPRPLLLGAAPRAWAPRRPLGTASAAADADGAAAAQAEPADEGEAEADDAEGDGAAAQAEPGGEEAEPGGEGGAPAGGGAQPQPFADALRAAEQLRESGAPLDDSTIGPLLKKAIGGGGSMKPQSAERVKAALELLEAEKAQPSAKLLWQLLSRLRHKRPNPHAGDIACDLVDEFFAAGTGLNIDTYNLLLGVVLRHRVKKVSQVAKALVEFPGVYANEKTFAIVIEACTRQGEVDQALGYVTRMEQMRYSPRPVLVFKLLELCALENDAKSARVCLRVLVGQANRRGVTLDDGSVIMLANLAARTGSHKLLNEVKEHLCYSGSPAPVSNESAFLHASLQCAAKAVKLDLCFETIEALATAGVEVDSATMWQAARAIAIDEETVDDAYYAVEARHQNDETVSVDSLNLVILQGRNALSPFSFFALCSARSPKRMEPWRAGAAPSFATSAGQSKHSIRSPTRSAWCRTFDRTMACCSAASGVATIRGPCRSSTRWHSKGSSLTAPPSPPSCWRWRRRWRQLATPRCERLLLRPRLAHWLISQCVATARRTSTIGLESCPPSLSLQRRRGTARLTTPWSLRHGRLPSREDSGRLGTSSGLCDPTGAPERQPARRSLYCLILRCSGTAQPTS